MASEKDILTPDERLNYDGMIDDWEFYATEQRFNALLEVATETCLSKPLGPIDRVKPTNDQEIVSMGGLHGLRIALELELKQEFWPVYDDDDEKDLKPGKFLVQKDSPLHLTQETRDPINFTIAKKVEQFGKALIEESYTVLGEGADEQVEKMRTGNREQQLEAIQWVSDRINAMKDVVPKSEGSEDHDDADDSGVFMYHPIRLSPKAVGSYPNMNLLPTCLGASIIVSSFFEKASVPYMHGGVGMTAFNKRLESGFMLFHVVKDVASVEKTEHSSPIVEAKMEELASGAYSQLVEDMGYHASVAVRLADGQWAMVDPYFKLVDDQIHESTSEDYSKIYDALNEFRETAPGLELTATNSMLNIEIGLLDTVERGYSVMQDPQSISKMMLALFSDDENGRDRMYNEIILPHFKSIATQEENPNVASVIQELLDLGEGDEGSAMPDLLREAYDQVVEKYVLWGEDTATVRNRLVNDAAYYRNRAVDLSYVTMLMCASIAARNLKDNVLGTTSHERMEFGLPYQRVGYSVLSDFASYTDDELPPTFWYAHWGSLVPITETLPRGASTQWQRSQQEFMGNWSNMRDLTYIKAYPIIAEFLQRQSSEEEDENGKPL